MYFDTIHPSLTLLLLLDPSLPLPLPHLPLNKPHVVLLIAHWVQLIQPICAWVYDCPLKCDQLAIGHIPKDKWLFISHKASTAHDLSAAGGGVMSPFTLMLECWLVKPYTDNHSDYGFMHTITLRCPADTVSQHSSLSSASNSCPFPSSTVF